MIRAWTSRALTRYLSTVTRVNSTSAPTDPRRLVAALRPADVLLVEGRTRVSSAIKYLTQSTWSHAALYVGAATGATDAAGRSTCFVEADIEHGVRAVAVDEFAGLHCRICRPIGLNEAEIDAVIGYAVDRIGLRYDLKNVVDLARWLLPTPPVPQRWRRRMLALGSGDPTRAICSTLIAQAFQSIRYPILPSIESMPNDDPSCVDCVAEILHVRHHSLFVPRDFDVSPYFAIVKPGLDATFDPHRLAWHRSAASNPDPPVAAAVG